MRSLQRRDYWAILIVSVVVFLIANGPIWHNPFEIDAHILISYAIIPVLVFAVLAFRKQLSIKGFLLDVVELILVKYFITASIAAVIWAFVPGPKQPLRRVAADEVLPAKSTPVKRPPPTVIESRATLRGTVVDAQGAPVEGAIVYVESGLEAVIFEASSKSAVLENDGTGFADELVVVEVGQALELRSTDHALHTANAYDEHGAFVVNLPMLAHGPKSIVVDRPLGFVRVRCTVHPKEPRAGSLLVLGHPFHVLSGPGGAFVLEGVPSMKVELAARHPKRAAEKLTVRRE